MISLPEVYVEDQDEIWWRCQWGGSLTWKSGLVLKCGKCLMGRVKLEVGFRCRKCGATVIEVAL